MTKDEIFKAVSEERARMIVDAKKKTDLEPSTAFSVIQQARADQRSLFDRAKKMCVEHGVDYRELGSDEFFELCDAEIERLLGEVS